jgi:hypothetical protein
MNIIAIKLTDTSHGQQAFSLPFISSIPAFFIGYQCICPVE